MAELVGWAVLFLIAWLFVSLWVGRDAKKNSPHSAFLWGLAVLVGGFLGLVLYFLLGRVEAAEENGAEESTETGRGLVECPNCHGLEDPKRSVCRFCEAPLDGK